MIRQFVVLAFSVGVTCADADQLAGRVVGVADGDTITVLDTKNVQHRIRLSGIDAPERKQAFGSESKRNLAGMVHGKSVLVDYKKRDRYGRIVGKVLVDGGDVCLDQIKSGMAWHYKKYDAEQTTQDRHKYAAAELNAKMSQVGLWADRNAIPPWEYRNAYRKSARR